MKDLNWIKTGYFAHRGLHNTIIPENTMAAFKNAVEHGFDIELDIRCTKDKKIVVFHDSTLKRLCDIDIKIKDYTYDELQEYKIQDTNETIPLLIDVLNTLPQETEYLIELKPVRNKKEFVSLFLDIMKGTQIKYAIHSFDPGIVYQFQKQDNSVIRGQIASTFPTEKHLWHKAIKHLLPNIITKPDFINYDFSDLPRKNLDRLYQKGQVVISYVVRNKEQLDFVRMRYDNAVFENFIPEKKKEM